MDIWKKCIIIVRNSKQEVKTTQESVWGIAQLMWCCPNRLELCLQYLARD